MKTRNQIQALLNKLNDEGKLPDEEYAVLAEALNSIDLPDDE